MVNDDDAVALAVDIGGTGIKCGIVDLRGVIRHAERHPTGAVRGSAAVLATILDATADLAATARQLGLEPTRVGVIVPGLIQGGTVLAATNVGLHETPLRDLVSQRTGLPTALGHDVRAAAMAEGRLGAGRTTRRLLFVALGTGIAGGFVLDGRVDEGAHGGAGEIGHITVRTGPDARACGCGGRGCLEQYASASAVARSYTTAAQHEDGSSAQDVAGLVAHGDPLAQRIWGDMVDALADGLLTASALFDPAVVALGGGLAEAGNLLLEPLRAALDQRRTFHHLPIVVRAELGEDAGVLGAALLAWDGNGDGEFA
jgi:glucokinase